jgi:hypothetical protein
MLLTGAPYRHILGASQISVGISPRHPAADNNCYSGTQHLWLIDYLSYGPPWAHYLGGYQDRLLGGPLGLTGLRYTAPDGVEHKDYGGEVLG